MCGHECMLSVCMCLGACVQVVKENGLFCYFYVVVQHHDQKQLKEKAYFGLLQFQMTRGHNGEGEEDMEKVAILLAQQENGESPGSGEML